jgi:hypothetical protein
MRIWAAVGVLLAAFSTAADDDDRSRLAAARQQALDSRSNCSIALFAVDGVLSVSYAGTGTDYRLIITVKDETTREAAARALGGGEKFEGLPVHWGIASLSSAPRPYTTSPASLPAPVGRVERSTPSSQPPVTAPYVVWEQTWAPARPVTYHTAGQHGSRSHADNCSPSRGFIIAGRVRTTSYASRYYTTETHCPSSASRYTTSAPRPTTTSTGWTTGGYTTTTSRGGSSVIVGGRGNNGVGNGYDPQPPGNPPVNDGAGTRPGSPGNRGGVRVAPGRPR